MAVNAGQHDNLAHPQSQLAVRLDPRKLDTVILARVLKLAQHGIGEVRCIPQGFRVNRLCTRYIGRHFRRRHAGLNAGVRVFVRKLDHVAAFTPKPLDDFRRRVLPRPVRVQRQVDAIKRREPVELRCNPLRLLVARAAAERNRQRWMPQRVHRHRIQLTLDNHDLAGLRRDGLPAEQHRLAIGVHAERLREPAILRRKELAID